MTTIVIDETKRGGMELVSYLMKIPCVKSCVYVPPPRKNISFEGLIEDMSVDKIDYRSNQQLDTLLAELQQPIDALVQ